MAIVGDEKVAEKVLQHSRQANAIQFGQQLQEVGGMEVPVSWWTVGRRLAMAAVTVHRPATCPKINLS